MQVAKEDYKHERAGMANIFMFFDCLRRWRKAKVTNTKKSIDFAECMRELVDEDYPEADVIRAVLNNLGTHNEASLYKAFPAADAHRILQHMEVHFTPKHAS